MKFTRLEKSLNRQCTADVKARRYYIAHGYMPTWAKENRGNPDAGIRRYCTETVWRKYQAGEYTRGMAIDKATARMERQTSKELAEKLDQLHRAETAPIIYTVKLEISWKKSATWGRNPHCTAYIQTANGMEAYTGTASGCGYDKETAAAAAALNQSNAICRALYAAKEAARGRISIDRCAGNAPYIAYGAGYGVLPYFEGGVGMSSTKNVFRACGFVVSWETHGRDYDVYMFSNADYKGVY